MPAGVDAQRLYATALREKITFAPGPLFSATGKYCNFLRLNAAFWSPSEESALATLGRLAGEQLAAAGG